MVDQCSKAIEGRSERSRLDERKRLAMVTGDKKDEVEEGLIGSDGQRSNIKPGSAEVEGRGAWVRCKCREEVGGWEHTKDSGLEEE